MDLTAMLIGGDWRPAFGAGWTEHVTSPDDNSVPVAGSEDGTCALTAAEVGAARWRRTPAHTRKKILLRVAEPAHQPAGDTAEIISSVSQRWFAWPRRPGSLE
ncbi:MAG TPA: hypothetical protein VI094_13595 [Propionibacteriaceae bacterium]